MNKKIKLILFIFIILGLVSCSSNNTSLPDSVSDDNHINQDNISNNNHIEKDNIIDNNILDKDNIDFIEFVQTKAPIYDENVYKLDVLHNGGFHGVDSNYFYLSYRRDDYWEYIRYNKNNEEPYETIYKTEDIYGMVFDEVYQERLYIIEVRPGSRYYDFQLIEINEHKQKAILYEFNSLYFPEVTQVNDNIVFTYTSIPKGEKNEMPIISVNMKSHEVKQIDIAYNTEVGDMNLNGYITRCVGGIDNLLYYTKIYFEDEAPIGEDDGTVFLYRYSYDDESITKICVLDKVPTYISGGKNFFVTSDYSPNDAQAKIGRFYYIHENGDISMQPIPEIEPTKHIQEIYRINEELIILAGSENIYLYNLKSHEYFMTKYIKPNEDDFTTYQGPVVLDNTIGYLVNRNTDEEVFYYEILLKDLIPK